MRIGGVEVNRPRAEETVKGEKLPAEIPGGGETEAAAKKFLADLQEAGWRQGKERCMQLLAQIDAQAERIKRSHAIADLYRYRQLVQEYMREAMGQMYSRQEERKWDMRGQMRVMAIVAEVDKKLGELTRLMLDKQQKGLQILEKLGEIRGLLLDIYR